MRVPEISSELIQWLRRMNPPRVIGRNEKKSSAHRRAGEQDIIDRLQALHDLQMKEGRTPEEDEVLAGDTTLEDDDADAEAGGSRTISWEQR